MIGFRWMLFEPREALLTQHCFQGGESSLTECIDRPLHQMMNTLIFQQTLILAVQILCPAGRKFIKYGIIKSETLNEVVFKLLLTTLKRKNY